MSAPLVRSVSGLRGVVGASLTPPVVAAHAWAFARVTGAERVVIGRDARPSGPELARAAAAGLAAAGVRAIDLGPCATPAVQIAVEEARAGGGLVVTASHNPKSWNGLKFVGADGTFLGPGEVEELWALADGEAPGSFSEVAAMATEGSAVSWHVARSLRVPEVDARAIAGRRLTVVVDGCRSVGGPSTVQALRAVGVEVVPLDCEPDGDFRRGLEPVPEHLGALGEAVRAAGADFGVAHDPDGDRAALVDAGGEAVGEELTLAVALETVLAGRPGPVVVNLSTSRMCEDVAASHGVPCWRSPVGEIHVVEEMRRRGAVAGGEGNGGVIVPASHYGRDGTLAALLVAALLSRTGRTLGEIRARLDRYIMIKSKLEGVAWVSGDSLLRREFPDATVDERDGLRFSWSDAWLSARPSQTEPLVRVIAEAGERGRAAALVGRAAAALRGPGAAA